MTDKEIDYLPFFVDDDNNKWELLSVNYCIDFGGRQAQCEFQRNNGDNYFPQKAFVYYYLEDNFVQWSSEEVIDIQGNIDSPLKDQLRNMFKQFDNEENRHE